MAGITDQNNNDYYDPLHNDDDPAVVYEKLLELSDQPGSNANIFDDGLSPTRQSSLRNIKGIDELLVNPTGDPNSLIVDYEYDDEEGRSGIGDINVNITTGASAQAHRNRSIEIFFGSLTTFHTFYQMLCEKGVGSSASDGNLGPLTKVRPETIKKLVLVGHPVTSFSGLNLFVRLAEAWITNCIVSEAKWADFMGLVHLHKLYIYNCQLNSLEPLYFQNLKVLWLSGNNLTSLSFLGQGLLSLNELNVAHNDITCILEEHLFKCVNLQKLNLSGNPICIFQDVQAVKVLPNLECLYLADPLYGKCPVSNICDSRAMFLSFLSKITSLDGRKVTPTELAAVKEYVRSRCLYYYANSVRNVTSHVALRKTMLSSANKQMEAIGSRLLELAALAAKYRRTISSVEVVPIFTNAKNLMKDQLMKIENRMLKLKEWKEVSTRRLEVIMQISRWEQEVEKWMKRVEFESYGNTQTRIAHSVHGAAIADGGTLCTTIHELFSALACPGLWPQNILLKVETVMVIRDKGMEAGIERIYYDNFAYKDEPKFVPPPPDVVENKSQNQYSTVNSFMMSPTNPYCPPPPPSNPKPVTTYTTPDYKPPAPLFSFPESVPGLPERSQPVFMFLVCPQTYLSNPLHYLQKILMDKSRHFKDIRVTNCLWLACHNKPADGTYAVLIVVKVLEECLQPVNLDRRGCSVIMRHSWDCATFSVKRPLAFAPAYVVNVSFTYENKQPIWHKRTMDDEDVLLPAETALGSLRSKIQMHGHPPMTKPGRAKTQPHLKRIGDGFHADLASAQINASKEGTLELVDVNRNEKNRESFDLHHVSKLVGKDSTQLLTSLDLSGNRLGLIVGLENVGTLKKLNLSYNNLTTLTGLQKLPNLIELKVGWNSLRFLHSNISTLAFVSPRLMTLEILPNPFQDVRDLAHIPILLHKALPLLHRVDIWSAPFTPPTSIVPLVPPQNDEDSFSYKAMGDIWSGTVHVCNDFASKCLTDLVNLPLDPPLPKEYMGPGIDLNLSDNYLTSVSLKCAPFCTELTWKTHLVKLQLQENVIMSMEWANGVIFPNCHILNLSINQIDEVDNIPSSFPALRHLHLSGNPLPCDISILSSFRSFSHLLTLDCTTTPLASHPEYPSFIIKSIPCLKMLDGAPISAWEIADTTEKLGGSLTPDWLEEKVGNRDWGSLQQLSLAGSGLQKVSLPPHALPKLLSLDVQDNAITNLSVLSSLPSLKVLCVSHNNVSALGGNPCPVCYSHTAQSQAAAAQKLRASKSATGSTFSEWNGKSNNGLASIQSVNKGTGFDSFGMPVAHQGHKTLPCHVKNDLRNTGAVAWGINTAELPETGEHISPPLTPLVPPPKRILSKPVFPKLEVLIMAHNGLTSLADLHLHAMQNLQTIILNCNSLTNLQGLENLPTVRAIVLDHNRIRDIPFNSLSGCKSLKYLHLEHNRITSLPRFPHLTNLSALYLAYNKIQSLTDLNALSGTTVIELSMAGNPLATRSDYRLNVAARVNQLSVLDGKDLAGERVKLGELASKWFPQSASRTADYNTNSNSGQEQFVYRSLEKDLPGQGISQVPNRSGNSNYQNGGDKEFSLKVKPLSSHLSSTSPRSLQYASHKQKLRQGYGHQES